MESFPGLLVLEVMRLCFVAAYEAERALEEARGSLRMLYWESLIIEPNGSRWIGFTMPEDWEEQLLAGIREREIRLETRRRERTRVSARRGVAAKPRP